LATPYSNIYKRFLAKIDDMTLANMTQADAEARMYDYLLAAISNFYVCKTNLNDRDDALQQFNQTLSGIEEDILATLMVIEWLSPYINSLMVVKQKMTGDFKLTSQAQHLHELQMLREATKRDVEDKIARYTYKYGDFA
jgi:DNA-binding PucR family transcriptional regulator